ncbi:exported hypothetical protein [Mesorhizobium metallidurans STM 2683]|uniref:Uncharacterized protein n=1 Tax=Mesorhizobium metallidurans STM 2683 TaxID=1297569 RepID=M5F2M3_9HYPH|nr:exported hypothetical protein [Mesorhizobium metallidurans STM 2683]
MLSTKKLRLRKLATLSQSSTNASARKIGIYSCLLILDSEIMKQIQSVIAWLCVRCIGSVLAVALAEEMRRKYSRHHVAMTDQPPRGND